MTRGKRPSDDRQRAREWYAFEALRALEGLPGPIPDHDDDPDFLVQLTASLLGVEVTSFYADIGNGGSEHAKTIALRSELLNRAEHQYRQHWPSEPVMVSAIIHDIDLVRLNRRDLALRLADFIHDVRAGMVGDMVTVGWPALDQVGLADVFHSIVIARLPVRTVFSMASATMVYSPPTLIHERIAAKDSERLDGYRSACSGGEVWLVIFSPDASLDVHDERVVGSAYQTRFDRVYLFDGWAPPVRLQLIPPGPGSP